MNPSAPAEPPDLLATGEAFKSMLSAVDVDSQLTQLKKAAITTKSISRRNDLVKQIKFLTGLKKVNLAPEDAYVIHNMPVIPPVARPIMEQPGNRVEYADVNNLYKDHFLIDSKLKGLAKDVEGADLIESRKAAYEGVKSIFGLGEENAGGSRGKPRKGFLRQIAGTGSPKLGFFQSKILNKKQDMSARATIYAEPNLGFNEIAVPNDMLWTLYTLHIIRDLVKNGYPYPAAKKAVEERAPAATASLNKLIKLIPVIANRAPTLMQSNITAHFPVSIKGSTLGVNPIHLPLYAGDFDGDAMTIHLPVTPEAIEEAKKKLLPEHHMYDFRKGINSSLIKPRHEAILGSMYLTDPDMNKPVQEFSSEEEVLNALKAGTIDVNTPVRLVHS